MKEWWTDWFQRLLFFIPANVGQRTCIAHQNWACKSVICRRVSSYAFWIGSRCWQVMNRHSKNSCHFGTLSLVWRDMMFKRSKANLRYIYNTPFSIIQKLARSSYFLMVSFLRSRRFWRSLVTMSGVSRKFCFRFWVILSLMRLSLCRRQ